MTLKFKDNTGVDRTINAIYYKDGSGIDHTLNYLRIGTKIIYTTVPSITISFSDSSPSGFTSGTGTATTNSTTATASLGTSPYTYAWAIVSHTGLITVTVNSPTSATTAFTATGLTSLHGYSAVISCTATDHNGFSVTQNITATFTDYG